MFVSALTGLDSGLRVAMVGDTPASDILGAHQAGLTGILVAQDSSQPQLALSRRDARSPDAVIPNLSGLFDRAVSLPSWDAPRFPTPDAVRLGVAAVVLDGVGRTLLLRQADDGRWDLPWGFVEPSETIAAAVTRVVRQELGLEIEALRLVGIYSDPVSHVVTAPDGRLTQVITACFACQAINGELQHGADRGSRATFFALETLPRDLAPGRGQWLSDAHAMHAAAFVR
jgi:ADP-ribose pyrophosphatase YjhB (NUDIX family)